MTTLHTWDCVCWNGILRLPFVCRYRIPDYLRNNKNQCKYKLLAIYPNKSDYDFSWNQNRFSEFFKSKDIQIVPSAPKWWWRTIPNSFMFTNAGNEPVQRYFPGNSPVKYKRIGLILKNASVYPEKHNDLGSYWYWYVSPYTMFEMLGN